jgi:hypothetical protein
MFNLLEDNADAWDVLYQTTNDGVCRLQGWTLLLW